VRPAEVYPGKSLRQNTSASRCSRAGGFGDQEHISILAGGDQFFASSHNKIRASKYVRAGVFKGIKFAPQEAPEFVKGPISLGGGQCIYVALSADKQTGYIYLSAGGIALKKIVEGAIGEASLSLLRSIGIGLTGAVGQGDVSLQLLGSIGADYAYSAGIVSFQPLTAYGIEEVLRPDFISSRATARARYHIAAPPVASRSQPPQKPCGGLIS